MLKEIQKKHLRRLGHALKPVVLVGNAGLSEAVMREIEIALSHHELVKIRLRVGPRAERDAAIEAIGAQTGAELVTRIGNVALLYRANPEQQRITLP